MKRYHLYLLSAIIFLVYGLGQGKITFSFLGGTFLLMALADWLKTK